MKFKHLFLFLLSLTVTFSTQRLEAGVTMKTFMFARGNGGPEFIDRASSTGANQDPGRSLPAPGVGIVLSTNDHSSDYSASVHLFSVKNTKVWSKRFSGKAAKLVGIDGGELAIALRNRSNYTFSPTFEMVILNLSSGVEIKRFPMATTSLASQFPSFDARYFKKLSSGDYLISGSTDQQLFGRSFPAAPVNALGSLFNVGFVTRIASDGTLKWLKYSAAGQNNDVRGAFLQNGESQLFTEFSWYGTFAGANCTCHRSLVKQFDIETGAEVTLWLEMNASSYMNVGLMQQLGPDHFAAGTSMGFAIRAVNNPSVIQKTIAIPSQYGGIYDWKVIDLNQIYAFTQSVEYNAGSLYPVAQHLRFYLLRVNTQSGAVTVVSEGKLSLQAPYANLGLRWNLLGAGLFARENASGAVFKTFAYPTSVDPQLSLPMMFGVVEMTPNARIEMQTTQTDTSAGSLAQ